MRVLAILHHPAEGLGRLEPILIRAGASISYARMYQRDPLPLFHYGFNAVISMGGPMSVHDREHEGFLSQESLFLRRAIEDLVPVLGVCLGSQMIARAMGGRVMKAPVRETGFFRVSLTEAGERDPFFKGVPREFAVLQWHEDTFELPSGAELLACGDRVKRQAFRIGNSYGLQFHLEANRVILSDWIGDDESLRALLDEYPVYDMELQRTVSTVGENFVSMVRALGRAGGSEDYGNEHEV